MSSQWKTAELLINETNKPQYSSTTEHSDGCIREGSVYKQCARVPAVPCLEVFFEEQLSVLLKVCSET